MVGPGTVHSGAGRHGGSSRALLRWVLPAARGTLGLPAVLSLGLS